MGIRRRSWRAGLVAFAAAAALWGCDYSYGPRNLKPGATIDEVRRQMGAATDEKRLADGTRVWWYVRGPQGYHTYRIAFDKDERVTHIDQVLTEENFRNIVAQKTTKSEVLDLLGRPRETMTFPLLKEQVWSWRYKDVTIDKQLHVHFDLDGVVKRYEQEVEQTSP